MTNKAKAMRDLLESCSGGYAELMRLVHSEIERDFVDDTDPPAELGDALDAILAAVEKLELLDEVSR